MSHKSSDGAQFTNRTAMRRHESRIAEKQSAERPTSHKTSGNEEDDIAAEHGAASEVTVTHKDGQHNVHSIHPDGFEHHDSHDTADGAHEAAKCLMGASEHAKGEGMGNEEGHSGIPGLTGY